MKYKTIVGKVMVGQLDRDTGMDLVTAKQLASIYISCRYCGKIHDEKSIGWLETADNGRVLPVSVACSECFQSAIPRLKTATKQMKLACRFCDSSKLVVKP